MYENLDLPCPKPDGQVQVLREVAQRIDTIAELRTPANVTAAAGLKLEKGLIYQSLKEQHYAGVSCLPKRRS